MHHEFSLEVPLTYQVAPGNILRSTRAWSKGSWIVRSYLEALEDASWTRIRVCLHSWTPEISAANGEVVNHWSELMTRPDLMAWIEARKLVARCTFGYDLDSGGYEWEIALPEKNLPKDLGTVLLLDSGLDYLPIGQGSSSIAFCAFLPGNRELSLPDVIEEEDGDRYVLVFRGLFETTDRHCTCVEWEEREGTGEVHPDCHRCDGDGTLESPGGAYGLYVWQVTVQ